MAVSNSNLCSRNFGSGRAGATHGKMCRKAKTFMELKKLAGNGGQPYCILRNILLGTFAVTMLLPEIAHAAQLEFENVCFTEEDTKTLEVSMWTFRHRRDRYWKPKSCPAYLRDPVANRNPRCVWDYVDQIPATQLQTCLSGHYRSHAARACIHKGYFNYRIHNYGINKRRFEVKVFDTPNRQPKYVLWCPGPKPLLVALQRNRAKPTEPTLRIYANSHCAQRPRPWHYSKCNEPDAEFNESMAQRFGDFPNSASGTGSTRDTSDSPTTPPVNNDEAMSIFNVSEPNQPVAMTWVQSSTPITQTLAEATANTMSKTTSKEEDPLSSDDECFVLTWMENLEEEDATHAKRIKLLIKYALFYSMYGMEDNIDQTDDYRLKLLAVQAHKFHTPKQLINDLEINEMNKKFRFQEKYPAFKDAWPKNKLLRESIIYLKEFFSLDHDMFKQESYAEASSPVDANDATVDGSGLYRNLSETEKRIIDDKRKFKQRNLSKKKKDKKRLEALRNDDTYISRNAVRGSRRGKRTDNHP